MDKPKVDLRDPWIAAGLAWIFPGLGHAYQRRWFKAILFCVCINATYFGGSALGDGKVTYFNWDTTHGRTRTYGYLAQVPIGLPASVGWIQSRRVKSLDLPDDRSQISLTEELSADFQGELFDVRLNGQTYVLAVSGRIELQPANEPVFARSTNGTFKGQVTEVLSGTGIDPGATVDMQISYLQELEPPIYPSPHRELLTDASGTIQGGAGVVKGSLRGECRNVRGLFDSIGAPLDSAGLSLAHSRLGKLYDIASVYTWIAGMLNILVIFDALKGPAYGYGDESDEATPAPTPPTGAPPAQA